MNNYELDIENLLKNCLKNRFNCKNSVNYIFLRFMIINKVKKLKDINLQDFIEFLLKECNLPSNLIYKELIVNKFNSEENSINNIVKNWIGDACKSKDSLSFEFYIDSNYKTILENVSKKLQRYKKTCYYKELLTFDALNLLNETFLVSFNYEEIYLSDIFYPDDFKFSNFEEDSLKNKLNILKNSDESIIFTEKEIEIYLKNNLDKIEEGLVYLDSQFKIKDAFIDILAKDKHNKIVIIELKVKNDERLVWQSIYYPKQYKIEHSEDNVRMICLSPIYNECLLSALEEVKNVSLYKYKLTFKDEEILDIFTEKIL